MESVGRHLIMELWECEAGLNDPIAVSDALREATDAAGATLLEEFVHPFTPQGVTGVAVISESHILIHTWPEYGYAAVDVFTCGKHVRPEDVVPVLKHYFKPGQVQVMEMKRGILELNRVPVRALAR
ncbi:MAG: adenosylmethionine decarboxylase [Dehalococcoidia bacterium]|nr:adenosylmethionine decarboxylase [Dehalococcoidia bacterium]